MFKLIAGIVVAFIAITFLTSFMEPMVEQIGISRGCNSLNCPGFIASDATTASCAVGNRTYDPDIETPSTPACTTIVLLPFILVAAVILAVLFGILYGDQTPMPRPYWVVET